VVYLSDSGEWVDDGSQLSVAEREEVARFLRNDASRRGYVIDIE
jgi:hypothetical protein